MSHTLKWQVADNTLAYAANILSDNDEHKSTNAVLFESDLGRYH